MTLTPRRAIWMEISLSREELWKFYLVSKPGHSAYLAYERSRKETRRKKTHAASLQLSIRVSPCRRSIDSPSVSGIIWHKGSFVAFSTDTVLQIPLNSHVRYSYTIPLQPF